MRRLASLATFLVVAAVPAAAAPASAAPDPWRLKQRIGQLRDANEQLRRELRDVRREHSRLAAQNGDLRDARDLATLAAATASNERDGLSTQVLELERRLAAADDEIRTLKATLVGELPDRVSYLARQGDFNLLHNSVLRPALANWPCRGSISHYSSIVSYTFDMYAAAGDCY
ncbi:MAG TPA: hypothetical protein VFR97_11930 [Capillimicrobium sp.]|nr:hypothetical protein [Capillimicrobium sp.]